MKTKPDLLMLVSVVGLLMSALPGIYAQEAAPNTAGGSTEAADHRFLKKLEQADAKKSTTPEVAAPAEATATEAKAPAKPVRTKELATVKKARETPKRSPREVSSKPAEAVTAEPAPVASAPVATAADAVDVEEDRRGEDNGFLHRFFAHIFHRERDVQ